MALAVPPGIFFPATTQQACFDGSQEPIDGYVVEAEDAGSDCRSVFSEDTEVATHDEASDKSDNISAYPALPSPVESPPTFGKVHSEPAKSNRGAGSAESATFVEAVNEFAALQFGKSRSLPTTQTAGVAGINMFALQAMLNNSSEPPHALAGLPSIGSALHGTGHCKPCGWFWKPSGCQNGSQCLHCHSCPQSALKDRRRRKAEAFKAGLLQPCVHEGLQLSL